MPRSRPARWRSSLGLAGCGPQDGDGAAGSRVATTAPGDLAGDPGGASPAAIAAAGLRALPERRPDRGGRAGRAARRALHCLGDGPDVRLAALRGTPAGPQRVGARGAGRAAPSCRCWPRSPGGPATAVQFLGVDVQDPSPDDALRLLADAGVRYPPVSDYGGATKRRPALGRAAHDGAGTRRRHHRLPQGRRLASAERAAPADRGRTSASTVPA